MRHALKTTLMSLLAMVFLASSAAAMVKEDLTGSWDVTYGAALTANGLATDSEVGTGVFTFNADKTFQFETDDGVIYSGTYRITGKAVHFRLDENGANALDGDIIAWATAAALEEGVTIEAITLNTLNVTITPSVLHKKAAVPGKIKLKARGFADVEGTTNPAGTDDPADDVAFSVTRKYKENFSIVFTGRHVDVAPVVP